MLSEYIFNSTNSWIKKSLHRFFGERLLKTTVFNATSDQEYRECKALIKDWSGFVLPNILDLPEIEVVKIKNELFTISFLSRIDPKKGLEFVFEAIALLDFGVRFRIAGKGDEDYIIGLKLLAQRLGIAQQIEWLGWIGPHEKYQELMRADLFVLASYNENFANVVVEALYSGTPVLISKYVGLADYIAKNDLGWVVELDSRSVAKAIVECKRSREKAAFINNNAHSSILSDFSPEVLSEKYLKQYARVIDHQS
jgi:glycosyltransferase involved in cell wall biosynthesis